VGEFFDWEQQQAGDHLWCEQQQTAVKKDIGPKATSLFGYLLGYNIITI